MTSPRRLTTWKDIGAYIGRDARTAKRYEAERRLPVHRLPGGGRSVVFAFAEEIDAWLRHQTYSPETLVSATPGDATASTEREGVHNITSSARRPVPDTAPSVRRPEWRRVAVVAMAAVLVAGGAGLVASYRVRQSPGGTRDALAAADFRDGEFAWRQRTPESLRRAVDLFTQAIVRDPNFANAYIGLANSYDLMPEFAGMSAADAYTRAEAAARRALVLSPRSAAAHSTYAFILFWWEHDVPRAWVEFQTALRLDPGSVEAHHWYANALAAAGDPRALGEIDTARALDPASTSIMIDAGWVRILFGRDQEAKQLFRTVEAVAPNAPMLHVWLGVLARNSGDYPTMLAEQSRVAQLRHDPEAQAIAAAGQRGLASGGAAGMWAAMIPLEEAANRGDRLASTSLAADELRLGRRAAALKLLDQAFTRHESGVLALRRDREFVELHGDPTFQRLAARLGPST